MVALELVTIVRTVYTITKALDNWLADRKEKAQVVCRISSIIQQIHDILLPLESSLEKSTPIDEQQLADCLKRIGEIITTTKEHLLVWDQSRARRLVAFFSPASVMKELKSDEQCLQQQLLLLLVAMTLKEHVRGRQQSVPVTVNQCDSDLKPPHVVTVRRQHTLPVGRHDLKAPWPAQTKEITPIHETEPESDLLVFWREFIGEKSLSVSATIFCQKLEIWMQKFISDVGAQRLLLRLDETGSGKITLVNVQQQVGTRNFRDAVISFSEEPTLPLLIYIGNNPENYSEHATYALESNVNIIQLSSTDQATAWIRINIAFIQRHDRASYIRFIADNVPVKTDSTSDTPVVNYSAGLNILRHIRNNGIKAPLLIRANTSIQATRFVEEFAMAGSTTCTKVCQDYILALGAADNYDFAWRKFMA